MAHFRLLNRYLRETLHFKEFQQKYESEFLSMFNASCPSNTAVENLF